MNKDEKLLMISILFYGIGNLYLFIHMLPILAHAQQTSTPVTTFHYEYGLWIPFHALGTMAIFDYFDGFDIIDEIKDQLRRQFKLQVLLFRWYRNSRRL